VGERTWLADLWGELPQALRLQIGVELIQPSAVVALAFRGHSRTLAQTVAWIMFGPGRGSVDAVRGVEAIVRSSGCSVSGGSPCFGCGGGPPMHSVREVQAAFADHGVRLSVTERNRVSTSLLPTWYVRAVPRTPALGTLPPSPGYEVVVFTSRRWLRDLPRHQQKAQRAVGGKRIPPLSNVSTRHDNVFIVYPAGAPKNLAGLRRIRQDI
jgi:hypothetical protein